MFKHQLSIIKLFGVPGNLIDLFLRKVSLEQSQSVLDEKGYSQQKANEVTTKRILYY